MLSFGEVKGDSNVSYTTQNGKVTTAAYVATACCFMLMRLCFFNDHANPLLMGHRAIKPCIVL